MAKLFSVCSMCRKEILVGDRLLRCETSTCNRKRNPLFFCSPGCWDAHLPDARHRDPAYTEEIAGRS